MKPPMLPFAYSDTHSLWDFKIQVESHRQQANTQGAQSQEKSLFGIDHT
ncbi:uncharacterized protein METZ01_LOCUS401199 [marine metagenome]|uniref:Uncharacterized protein n=1 Tax=marine metagenome TaxID=408172 RepID=A0A382VQT1_9ZZZZ